MGDLAKLLFAAASVDRLTLFSTIAKEKLRLTQLAGKLSASTQETSRHLSRLQEAELSRKSRRMLHHNTVRKILARSTFLH